MVNVTRQSTKKAKQKERMSTIAFYPNKAAKGDGFNVFYPEAKKFDAYHNGTGLDTNRLFAINAMRMTGIVPVAEKRASMSARRKQVLDILKAHRGTYDHVAFFCHGWRTGMQFGFDMQTAKILAAEIARGAEFVTIVDVTLYSCSCGSGDSDGDGGFADALRDELCKAGVIGCKVVAHTTAGHATSNPYVREFNGNGSPVGGTGGQWIVAPGSELWGEWIKALRTTNLRFELASGIEYIHGKLVK